MTLGDTFGDGSSLLDALTAYLRLNGLQSMLAGFNDAGAEEQVQSWVGTIPDEPVDSGDVKRALGHEPLDAMAAELGTDADRVAEALARLIPVVVDAITPGGDLPTGPTLHTLDLRTALAGTDVGALLA